MAKVLIYEYLTAIGLGQEPGSEDHGMYCEGLAMRDALAEDLYRLPGMEVEMLHSSERCEREDFQAILHSVESVLLIAPEIDGILLERARWVQTAGKRSWGSSLPAIQLASDKWCLSRRWNEQGVPTPRTWKLESWPCDSFPVVLKARDGAGSSFVLLCQDLQSFEAIDWQSVTQSKADILVQDWVPGRAVSVSFLIGPRQVLPLMPAGQRLSADGRFQYLGGDIPLSVDCRERAIRLGLQAIQAVPGLAGYVGVDLVLGNESDGSGDRAIEINPRLTTSYVGLRALSENNLAGLMWQILCGERINPVHWKAGKLTFTPSGELIWSDGLREFGNDN